MAVLNASDRQAIAARIMEKWNRSELNTIGITAAQLLTMVGDIDTWIDSNAAAVNAATQQPARGATSAKIKAFVFREILVTRYLREH